MIRMSECDRVPTLRLIPWLQAWKIGIDLNLNAHFNLIHRFLPLFKVRPTGTCSRGPTDITPLFCQEQKSGNIIHFTTIASSVGLGIKNQRHAYAAGKSGAAVLTKRIGVENAADGIRANVIGIGYVTGPLVNRAVAQAQAGGASVTLEQVTAGRDAYVPRGYQILPEEVTFNQSPCQPNLKPNPNSNPNPNQRLPTLPSSSPVTLPAPSTVRSFTPMVVPPDAHTALEHTVST